MTCLFKRDPGEWYRSSVWGAVSRQAGCARVGNSQPKVLRGQTMKPNPKISAAVAAILGASTTMLVFAAAPADTTTDTTASTEGVQEVVVTAQRRSEN